MSVIIKFAKRYNEALVRSLDIAYSTMFAELSQRCLDASFQSEFPVEGRFVTVPVKGRDYWYFDQTADGSVKRRYVGPHSDPEITRRVEHFKEIKESYKGRRKLVTTLIRDAGLQPPERLTGDIVEALASAGFFRMRGVLVGTVAFQCYAGLLGVRLASTAMQTGDADFAQFHSISVAIEDSLPPILDVLRAIDDSFREVPHQMDGRRSFSFANKTGYKVEFLTPNRGSADFEGLPANMPALGGASAQPLRFLDYLIYEPVRSVLLHKSGVSVTVPAPERYAVHKLIVASRRRADRDGIAKRNKDVFQAQSIMETLAATRRQSDLAMAYTDAFERGPAWRDALSKGWSYLPKTIGAELSLSLVEGMKDAGLDPREYGYDNGSSHTPK